MKNAEPSIGIARRILTWISVSVNDWGTAQLLPVDKQGLCTMLLQSFSPDTLCSLKSYTQDTEVLP